MNAKRKHDAKKGQIFLPLGGYVRAHLDEEQDLLVLTCEGSGLEAMFLVTGEIEAGYDTTDGRLGIGAWMALHVKCSPEEAVELASAMGPRVLASLTFIP
jgi:hypothetical protein